MRRRGMTAEAKAEARQKALAFQETLTKTGTVRKRKNTLVQKEAA